MITNSFDPVSAPMIRPDGGKTIPGPVPETVIATFSGTVMDLLGQYPGETVLTMKSAAYRPRFERFEYQGRLLGRWAVPLGGPCAVALSEELFALGVKRMIFCGSCGRLTPGGSGDLILPDRAYRDEGTSYHYMAAGDWVEIPTCGRLRSALEREGFPCETGPVWTTDAFYRETEDNAFKRRRDGCIAVDMECASIFAAAAFHGWEVYQFFYTLDALLPSGWEKRTMGALPTDHALMAAEAALAAASAFSG